jgi:integrase
MKAKLDRKALEGLRTHGEGRARVFDTKTTGFFARRTPSGHVSFGVVVGPKKARREIIIGPLGPFTLDKARAEAERLISESKLGHDPAGTRAKENATPTFKKWAEEYLKDAAERLAPRWVSETSRYLKAVPFGSKLVSEVTVEDVKRFYQAQREKASKKGTTGVTTGNRALAAVRACLKAAWSQSLIPENPALKIKHARENEPRQRVLSDDELARFITALDAEPDPYIRAGFHLLIECGARKSEVLRTKWEDLDLQEGVWRLPKTKSGRSQVVPLPESMKAMLEGLTPDGPWLLPGRKANEPRRSLQGPWLTLKKAAKLEEVTPHDIRRTYGLAVARVAGLHAASKLLRHSSVELTARVYAPLGLSELREATEKTAKERQKRTLKVVNGGQSQEE